ncbi:MAG: hypothetical protein ACE10E_08555, partial [Acidiferrobacterales bacterium]
MTGPETLCFGWPTLMAYLRISTHPRIFGPPLSAEKAVGNVESLLDLPQVRVLSEGDGFWSCYRQISGTRFEQHVEAVDADVEDIQIPMEQWPQRELYLETPNAS